VIPICVGGVFATVGRNLSNKRQSNVACLLVLVFALQIVNPFSIALSPFLIFSFMSFGLQCGQKRIKVVCTKSDHLRIGPPFSRASVDGNIFSLFFKERKMNVAFDTSAFINFQTILN